MNSDRLTMQRLESALRSHAAADSLVPDGSRAAQDSMSAPAPAAVTVLFNMTDDQPCVLMIKRASTLTHHGGEWAFPGGMIEDTDESPMQAALRETDEELGVGAKDIDLWCAMPPVDTTTGFEVWPYAGRVSDGVVLTPYAPEVAEVVSVPVSVFVDRASRRTITLIRKGNTRTMAAYAYGDRIIWGASARIIANTIDIVNRAA